MQSINLLKLVYMIIWNFLNFLLSKMQQSKNYHSLCSDYCFRVINLFPIQMEFMSYNELIIKIKRNCKI